MTQFEASIVNLVPNSQPLCNICPPCKRRIAKFPYARRPQRVVERAHIPILIPPRATHAINIISKELPKRIQARLVRMRTPPRRAKGRDALVEARHAPAADLHAPLAGARADVPVDSSCEAARHVPAVVSERAGS